jgi:hypothetical protein
MLSTLKGMIASSVLLAGTALAHGGGVAADGCHVERRTGARLCHGARRRRIGEMGSRWRYAANSSPKPQPNAPRRARLPTSLPPTLTVTRRVPRVPRR